MYQNRAAVMVASVLALTFVAPAGADWVVTEIPNLPGWNGDTNLYDINDSGVVCGIGGYVSGVSSVAFSYDGTLITELPYLHPSPATHQYACASAINSSGVIAGRAHNADGVDRAVFWTGTTITEIPLPPDANTNSDMRGYGINDAGVVVGYYVSTTTGYPAAFYYDGTSHSLVSALQAAGLTGLRSYARDVNNNGLICGEAEDAISSYNFFTYDIGTGTVNVLGTIYPTEDYFTAAINDAGHVVGRGRTLPWSPIHALLHDGSFNVIDDTILVAQWSADVTNHGRIVGNADTSSNRWSWYSDAPGSGSMVPIDLPGWTRLSVQGVNAHDVIAGYGRTTASPDDDRAVIIAPPPGDADHDGDIDVDDFLQFAACMSGPEEGAGFTPPSQACLDSFDLAPSSENYALKEIPSYPGWVGVIEAYGVNSNGVVCGNGNYVVNTSSTPFRYDGFTVTPLPILPGANLPIALARAINAHGVICGYSREADGDSRAVYWEGTTVTALPYPPGMNTSLDFRAYDINDHDVIVGYYYNTNGHKDAFYYKDGASYNLLAAFQAAGLTGWHSADSVNNGNVICGTAEDALGLSTPWTYDIDTGVLTVIDTISTEGTSAADINESGQMQGRAKLHAADVSRVLYYDGTWHVVDPTVNSTQYTGAMNDGGRMVGSTYIGSGNRSGWYSDGPGDGSMIPLDLAGWTSVTATDINNNGVIVGYGESPTAGGDNRGFIYTPIPGDGDIDLQDFAEFQRIFEGS
ncbi:MAG: DUF3466 family protein [Phycisphaerales bacterium]|nr:MAG: DUF3466 family protein [Phycisphaerales bacterium]